LLGYGLGIAMVNNVPFTEVTLIDGIWRFTWGSGAGLVRLVLWGVLLAETTDNEFLYPASSLHASLVTAPPIEAVLADDNGELLWDDEEPLVWDDDEVLLLSISGETALSERNLPFLVLQWYRVTCHHYVIEYRNGSDWIFHSTVNDDVRVHIQTFTTPLLADQTESRWRVVALDDNKRESDPVDFRAMVVRPPNVPVGITLACTGGTLTVQ